MFRLIRLFSLLSISLLYTAIKSSSQSKSYKNYTADDGLPSSTVYTSFQDSKGFMWFGTPMGASRYDGHTFKHFTIRDGLSDNEIFNFFEDSSGKIWFQTSNGRVSYFKNGLITNSSTDSTLKQLDSPSHISGMFEDAEGTIWISSLRNGIACYTKDKRIQRIFYDNKFGSITDIFSIGNKRIAIVGRAGIFKIQMNKNLNSVLKIDTCQLLSRENLVMPKSIQLTQHDILFSSRESIYWGNLKDEKFKVFMNSKSNSRTIYNLCQDDDHVWICTSKGALPYSKKTKRFLMPVLQKHKISSVLTDREGNYWITTLNNGVFFCSGQNIFSYTVENGLISNHITCLAKDSTSTVWFGHEEGFLGLYHNGIFNFVEIANKSIRDYCRINKIYLTENRCWVASSLGVYLWEENSLKVLGSNARDVIEHPRNHLWVGSSDRISKLTKATFDKYKNDAETLPKDYKVGFGSSSELKNEGTNSLFLDKQKNIWISTANHLYKSIKDSLVCIDPEKFNDRIHINDFEQLSETTILLATNGNGIIFLEKNKEYFTIGEEQDLSSGVCNALAVDGNGAIWVATNKGLNKITGYPHRVKVEHFTTSDGMLTNEINDVLLLNDTVWVATKKGINFFNENIVLKNNILPLIYIDYIGVQGKPKVYPPPQHENLFFEYTENDITIKYISPFYNSVGEVLYRYKLHRKSPWKYTKDAFVYLPELSWGNYEFIVAASGRSGVWSKDVSLLFTVKKPFWQSNFFIALTIFLITAIAWAGVALYFGQQKTKAIWQQKALVSELKTLRAQMNPHFIFNALNSIQVLFLQKDKEIAQDYLGRFGKLLRSILDRSEDATIPITEEISSITNYIEIEKLRMNHNFKYEIKIDPEVDIHTGEIPSMILQPFIENSIWHGFHHTIKEPRLFIHFSMDTNNNIIVTLKDNGIGRKKSLSLKKNHHPKGTSLIRDRIEIINFEKKQKIELSIEDLEDDHGNHPGTLVTLKIPNL